MFTINLNNFHGLWFLRSEIRAKKDVRVDGLEKHALNLNIRGILKQY